MQILLFFVYSLLALAMWPLWLNQETAVLTKGHKCSNHFFFMMQDYLIKFRSCWLVTSK